MDLQLDLESYLDEYCKYIIEHPDEYINDEGYKYKAVATFRSYFDLTADDMYSMVEASLKDTVNLVQSRGYFPKEMLLRCIHENPEYVREQLRGLLSETMSVYTRIDNFIYNMKTEFQKEGEKLYLDYRFLSFFLASHNPKRYVYTKYDNYVKFAEKVGYGLDLGKTNGSKYASFLKLANTVRDELRGNKKFLAAHQIVVADYDYKDKELSWGTYDFIYNVVAGKWTGKEIVDKEVSRRKSVKNAIEEIWRQCNESEEAYAVVVGKSKKEMFDEAKRYESPEHSHKLSAPQRRKVRIENAKQKERVKYLNDYKCQVCNFTFEYLDAKKRKRRYAHADHIIEKSKGGTERLDNLWVLCPNCHTKKTLGVIKVDVEKKTFQENGKKLQVNLCHLEEYGWR